MLGFPKDFVHALLELAAISSLASGRGRPRYCGGAKRIIKIKNKKAAVRCLFPKRAYS
jgi:hypothetical protein